MLKTYYHGTVTAFLPEIEKQGLRPTAKHTWKIHFDRVGELQSPDDGMPIVEGVYMTADRHHAEAYAQTRADYFQRKPGSCFAFFQFPENKKLGDYLYLSKDADAPVLHTHPVLLILSIDSSKLEPDENDSNYGLVCREPLPPSVITDVVSLTDDYDTHQYTKAYRNRIRGAAYSSLFGDNASLAKMIFGEEK